MNTTVEVSARHAVQVTVKPTVQVRVLDPLTREGLILDLGPREQAIAILEDLHAAVAEVLGGTR